MNRVALSLIALCLGPTAGFVGAAAADGAAESLPPELADVYSDLTQQLTVENQRAALLAIRLQNANTENTIAEALQSAAQARLAAVNAQNQAEAQGREHPDIVVRSAEIHRVADLSLYCNAMPFIEWRCHPENPTEPRATLHICRFPIDATICALPGGAEEPMMLHIEYRCDTSNRVFRGPIGANAFLSCQGARDPSE